MYPVAAQSVAVIGLALIRRSDLGEPCDPEGGVCLGQRHPVQLSRLTSGSLVKQDVAAGSVFADDLVLLAQPRCPLPSLDQSGVKE